MSAEHDKARAWRDTMGLSRAELARLSGFSQSTIADLESGKYRTTGRAIEPEAWLRYRLACAALTARLQFDWQSCRVNVTETRTVDLPISLSVSP